MKKTVSLILCVLLCMTSFSCTFAEGGLTVVSATPADGLTGITNISTDTENYNDTKYVSIEFSEAVEKSTVSSESIVIASEAGNLAWETFKIDGNFVKIDISQLESETEYTVTVNSMVETAAGANLSAPYSFTFTTGIIIPVASADNKVIVNVAKGKEISTNIGSGSLNVSNLEKVNDGIDYSGFAYISNNSGSSLTAQIMIDLLGTYEILAIEYITANQTNLDAGYKMNIAGRISPESGEGFATTETSVKTLAITNDNTYGIKVYGDPAKGKTPVTLVYAGTEFLKSGRYFGVSGSLGTGKKIGTFELKAYAQIKLYDIDDDEEEDNRPTVLDTVPTEGATGITNINDGTGSDTKFITVTFAENILPDTVTEETVKINSEEGTPVEYSLYKAEGNKVMIDISALESNKTYTVTISGIQAESEEYFKDYTFSFTTGIIIPVASDENKTIINVAKGKPVSANNSEIELKYVENVNDGNTASGFFYTATNKTGSSVKAEMLIDLQNSYKILALEYTCASQANIDKKYTMNITGRVSNSDGDGFATTETSVKNLGITNDNTYGIKVYGSLAANANVLIDYSKSDFLLSGRYVGFSGSLSNGGNLGCREFKAYAQVTENIHQMKASFGGNVVAEENSTTFTENGEYTFSADITNYSETGASYMLIAASYDAEGKIKEINCKKLISAKGATISPEATVTAYSDTAKMSAVLITSFEKAGMLLDGFELTRAVSE